MKTSTKIIPILAFTCLVGCSGPNHTEGNVFGGAVLGAGAGALVGAAINSSNAVGWGALIGAGVGAVGGYIYDQSQYDDY
jgi:uncharacterized membrane protein